MTAKNGRPGLSQGPVMKVICVTTKNESQSVTDHEPGQVRDLTLTVDFRSNQQIWDPSGFRLSPE